MSRILLEQIPALTFYRDSFTSARRTSPIPQLVCRGKACDLYTPDVVRCTNIGGHGTEVDWKCEADLPESLRLGRVEVSCEGWARPGDPYVLKGSCGLDYRLVQVPAILRGAGTDDYPRIPSKWFQPDKILSSIFLILWTSVLLFILYKTLRSCLRARPYTTHSDPPSRRPPHTPSGRGSFPGDYFDDSQGPPPPYAKHPPDTNWLPWQPGFWTGAALGGLGTYLFNRNGRHQPSPPPNVPPSHVPRFWDWERPGATTSTSYDSRGGSFFTSTRRPTPRSDRGEGPSNLGSMRTSMGFGGSRVR